MMTYDNIVHRTPAAVQASFTATIGKRAYYIIFGNYENGYFCSIPSAGVACDLSEPSDIFYNAEKLQCHFPAQVAQAMALCIHAAMDSNLKSRNWKQTLVLPTRARHCLEQHGRRNSPPTELVSVADVANLSLSEIYRIRNAGPVVRREIALALQNAGIQESAWLAFLPKNDPSPIISE